MKILICGDSFACDWQVKYKQYAGWPNLLAKEHAVTNLAQAGCSEYKIYRQIRSVDLTQFDKIIVSHTSPYRIPVEIHPIHHADSLHNNCDLIYSDIVFHSQKNKNLRSIVDFYENYFDQAAFLEIHNLFCEKIETITANYNTLHIAHINWENLWSFKLFKNYQLWWENHKGLINHYSKQGNILLANDINTWISS